MKYEQLTLPGIFEEKRQQLQEENINYAFPCGGCLCCKCANNVENLNVKTGEQKEACFNCDYCRYYNGEGKNNKKFNCKKFIITDYQAEKERRKFKIVGKKAVDHVKRKKEKQIYNR